MKSLRIILIGLLTTALLFVSIIPVAAQDEQPQPGTQPKNPVALFLSGVTGLTAQQISDLQTQGYGMGEISKAYYLVKNGFAGDIPTILAQAKTSGWGQLFKQAGVKPGGGVGWLFKGKGNTAVEGQTTGWTPPGHAKKNNGWVPPGQQKKLDKNNVKNNDKKGKK
jgi:hypothetical protein